MDYQIELTTPAKLFDGQYSWCHPRAGTIPSGAEGNDSCRPLVVMTLQKILLEASDVFSGMNEMRTADLGQTWSEPTPVPAFERQPFGENREITVCDFTSAWHAASGRLIGTGHTVVYENNRLVHVRPRATAYAVYDATRRTWGEWRTLKMPDDPKFSNAGAGATQRVDLPNGDILLPVYFTQIGQTQYSATVVRCGFDGRTLRYLEHGSELTVGIARGFVEPSLTTFGGRYFLTLRNDERGYVAVSDNGLGFGQPRPWTFDDGTELGSYNTQQHWVTHRGTLYLAYTRRGANNDHVIRHRAPLFIAQVDPERLVVLRSTERVLMPERGARLGNFAVTNVSQHETWVTDAEWMQPIGCEERGSDGSVWVSRILWSEPNS